MAKILVVDAQPYTAAMVSRMLRRSGHEVYEASQSDAALRVAARRPFDIVIADAELPDMDGVSLLQKLRAMQPGCMRVVTAAVTTERIREAYQCGTITRIIERPFSKESLEQALGAVLRLRQEISPLARLQRRAAEEEERALLQEFFDNGDLRLALQPIVSSQDEDVFGFEVLIRSQHPILRNPLAIIQAAERLDAISLLAGAIAREAAEWLARLPTHCHLFINVHPDELRDLELLEERLSLLDPSRVVLELTDIRRLPSVHGWEQRIARIQELGYAISIDNLTDNYSALGLLAVLQPSYMRADMSVTRGVDQDPTKQRLIEMMRRLAEASDAQLIAGGVETPEEAAQLRQSGVAMMQGYLFGRPSTDPGMVLGHGFRQDVISAA